LFAVMMVVSVLAVAPVVSATVTVYADDRPGWESAVGVYQEEFFTDAELNPGVSVVSDNGYVNTTNGVWWDKLVCPESGMTNTTWQFAMSLYGFGGDWNLSGPGGPGANISVAIDGSWFSVGEIPNTYADEFWGFVSSEPFSAVRLSNGSNCYPPGTAWCETYELDNMVYSKHVEKDYRYTNVCFEKDNDLDGNFSEDPVNFDVEGNPIDDDGDGLYNEDDVDCPGPEGTPLTSLGTLLPTDGGNYTVEAVVHKNGKVSSYNPGQYYAVSTFNVREDVENLTIEENWCNCTNISALNPKKGGGSVVIVQVGPDGVAYQILDAESDEVTVNVCKATAVLEDVSAGTTILMYVKFGPAQKHRAFEPGTCVNMNSVETNLELEVSASATLELIEKE